MPFTREQLVTQIIDILNNLNLMRGLPPVPSPVRNSLSAGGAAPSQDAGEAALWGAVDSMGLALLLADLEAWLSGRLRRPTTLAGAGPGPDGPFKSVSALADFVMTRLEDDENVL